MCSTVLICIIIHWQSLICSEKILRNVPHSVLPRKYLSRKYYNYFDVPTFDIIRVCVRAEVTSKVGTSKSFSISILFSLKLIRKLCDRIRHFEWLRSTERKFYYKRIFFDIPYLACLQNCYIEFDVPDQITNYII